MTDLQQAIRQEIDVAMDMIQNAELTEREYLKWQGYVSGLEFVEMLLLREEHQ